MVCGEGAHGSLFKPGGKQHVRDYSARQISSACCMRRNLCHIRHQSRPLCQLSPIITGVNKVPNCLHRTEEQVVISSIPPK